MEVATLRLAVGPLPASVMLEALAHAMSAFAHHRAAGRVQVVLPNPSAMIARYREYRRALAAAHLRRAGRLVVLVVLVHCSLLRDSARSICVVSARCRSAPANGLSETAGPALATPGARCPDLAATSSVKLFRARESQADPAEIGQAHFETHSISQPPRIRGPQDKLFVR